MSKIIKANLFLLMSFCCLIACKTKKVANEQKSSPLLENCWTHSYEEDQDGNKIYRPCDYKTFPQSRYRHQFTLKENGISSYLVLSPTDGHYTEDGKWHYKEATKSLKVTNKNGELKDNLEVVEVMKDKLIIKTQ